MRSNCSKSRGIFQGYSLGLGSLAVGIIGVATGCASSEPTPYLVSAREAYQQAVMGRAAEDAPAELLTAKQTLEEAEKAHDEHAGSADEKHLGYLAERQAKLAMAQADIVGQERTRAQAERDFVALQADISRQRQQEVAQLQTEVTGERAARQEAESALENLRSVGSVRTDQQGQTVITLPGAVLFKPADNNLLPIARESLARVADALKQQPGQIIIEGHADARGPATRNQELSLLRAESVRDYLIDQGVKPEIVRVVGRGEAEPIASNRTPEGRAINRRVEIIVRSEEQRKEQNQGQGQGQQQRQQQGQQHDQSLPHSQGQDQGQ